MANRQGSIPLRLPSMMPGRRLAVENVLAIKEFKIIDPVEISKIRLVISESEAKPKIKNFSVYFVK